VTFLSAAWGARLGRPRPTLPLAESPCPFKTSIFIGLCGPARAAGDIRGPPPARELRVRRAGESAVKAAERRAPPRLYYGKLVRTGRRPRAPPALGETTGSVRLPQHRPARLKTATPQSEPRAEGGGASGGPASAEGYTSPWSKTPGRGGRGV
jgi:hypothetical protein